MANMHEKEDLRSIKTRDAIRSAFIQLLCEMDFNSISIATLMKKAGYSRGAFYLHYPNIWAVYEELVQDYLKDLFAGYTEGSPLHHIIDEYSFSLLLKIINAIKEWYPFGKILLNKRKVPNIMPDIIEHYYRNDLLNNSPASSTMAIKYASEENDAITDEMVLQYCVVTQTALFECVTRHVSPHMKPDEIMQLAKKIYAGNIAWNKYQKQIPLQMDR